MLDENEKTNIITCGLIMPISAMNDYTENHWSTIKKLIEEAMESINEYHIVTKLVSESEGTGIIQAEIVRNIYDNDIIICDVSGKNPNVMFELGLRLAFDKPIIIIKDDQTDYSFDTSPIQHLEYKKDLPYYETIQFTDALISQFKNTYHNSSTGSSYLKNFGNFDLTKDNKVNFTPKKTDSFTMKQSIDIFDDILFDEDERLLFLYSIENEQPFLQTIGNMLDITQELKVWETDNQLAPVLSGNYLNVVKKLNSRNFIEKVSDINEEDMEYRIIEDIYVLLKKTIKEHPTKVNGLKLRNKVNYSLEKKSIDTGTHPENKNNLNLYLKRYSTKSKSTIKAKAIFNTNGYTVLKGSQIEQIDSDSIPNKIKKIRDYAKISESGILEEDILFTSPSSAAVFVVGGYTNGRVDWRTKEGKTLKEIQEENLDFFEKL